MVVCLTEEECAEATSHMLLWFAPMLDWFPGKMARQTVFATAVWFYCQSWSRCLCSAGDNRDAHWKKGGAHAHTHTLSCSSTVTAGMSLTPQIVMRSLHPTQTEREPGGCAPVKQKRVHHVLQKGQRSGRASPYACPLQWIQDRELVTSHRATRSDSQTLIMVSTSCTRSVWLLSTSLLTFPPATFWQSLSNLSFSLAWTFFSPFSVCVCVSFSLALTHLVCNN